jgi:iron complex transport system substrate-binding protein
VRIVSLLPSTTEILFAIGAGDSVVGVTFECDYPPEARTRPIVSNTALPEGLTPAEIDRQVRARVAAGEDLYRLDEGALQALDPDAVVTQDLCAVCAVDVANVDDALRHLGCRAEVITCDPSTLDEVLDSILELGRVAGRDDAATALVEELRARLRQVATAVEGRARPRVALLEWTDPPFVAGHWLPDMIEAAGGVVAIGRPGQKSVSVSWADVAQSRPDLVVVSPCGYRLEGSADLARQLVDAGVLPTGVPVWAVDADAAFVRPGPRVVDGVEVLAALLHPDALPARPDMAVEVVG